MLRKLALVSLLGCSLAGAGSIFYNGYQQPYLNSLGYYGKYAPASLGYYGKYGYNALAYQSSDPATAYQGSLYPSVAPLAPYSTASQGAREPKSNGLCSKVPAGKYKNCAPQGEDNRTFYDYHSEDIEKLTNVSFSEPKYQGKVLMVVNLASFWGYTPQYYALNALTERYADKPFMILGFPCNQFLRQEPGANASEIYAVLKHVRPGDDFEPNFEMFAKSDVNGKNENPIYTFLKSRCPSVRKEFQAPYKLYYDPYHQDDIRWNFEKFLLDHNGQPVRRYDESLDPSEMIPDIDALIDNISDNISDSDGERISTTTPAQ